MKTSLVSLGMALVLGLILLIAFGQHLSLDKTIKVTDLVTILALFAGPILAVQITESMRRKEADNRRQVHIFRTLMATRKTILEAKHVEALNLVEFEFKGEKYREVVEALKLYIAHMYTKADLQYWENHRIELMAKLLYEMSKCLGFNYEQAQIQTGAYSPKGWITKQAENLESRKLWLEILRGDRTLNCYNSQSQSPHTPSNT